jgi:hypothetical protein
MEMGVFKTLGKGLVTGGVTFATDGYKKAKYGTTQSKSIKSQKLQQKANEYLRQIAEQDGK